jgi:hypothetical protein
MEHVIQIIPSFGPIGEKGEIKHPSYDSFTSCVMMTFIIGLQKAHTVWDLNVTPPDLEKQETSSLSGSSNPQSQVFQLVVSKLHRLYTGEII